MPEKQLESLQQPCHFHAGFAKTLTEVGKAAIEQATYGREHGKQLTEVFRLIGELTKSVTANEVRAAARDTKLSDIKGDLKVLQDTVENGINDRVSDMTKVIKGEDGLIAQVKVLTTAVVTMGGCLDRKKREAEERAKEAEEFTVWTKFFKMVARSINKQVENANWVLIIFFVMWLLYGGDGHILQKIAAALDILK